MKAAYFSQTGGPEVIRYGDLPTPEPGDGEVRVRVAASSVNPIDTYIRSGAVAMDRPDPFIPGCDVAGVVDKTGPNVVRFRAGDRVWGSNLGVLGRQGGFAEFACCPQDFLYPTPSEAADRDMAALALVGITAHLGLFERGRLQPEETVFVNGGTGGVGAVVVQMARAVGAKVVTTAGSESKAALARELGADCVINYKTDDVAVGVKKFTDGAGVNVWYETLREPDFERTVGLLAPRGRMIVMAGRQAKPAFPVGPFYVKGLSVHGFAMFNSPPAEQRICADDINLWVKDGKLRAVVGREFPLSEAAAAHALQEENTLQGAGTLTGKIVVLPEVQGGGAS